MILILLIDVHGIYIYYISYSDTWKKIAHICACFLVYEYAGHEVEINIIDKHVHIGAHGSRTLTAQSLCRDHNNMILYFGRTFRIRSHIDYMHAHAHAHTSLYTLVYVYILQPDIAFAVAQKHVQSQVNITHFSTTRKRKKNLTWKNALWNLCDSQKRRLVLPLRRVCVYVIE